MAKKATTIQDTSTTKNPGGMKPISSATLFALTMDNETIITESASIMIKLAEAVSYLETVEDMNGQLILSRKRAKHMRTWEKILKAEDDDVILEGIIKRKTKTGFVVDIDGIESILPSLLLVRDEKWTKGNILKVNIMHTEPLKGTLVVRSSAMPKAEANLTGAMLNMREIISLHIGQAG